MENGEPGAPPFVQVAEIEVDAVLPERSGFVLDGRGADGADYRLELHLDVPLDQRTQRVLAGLLTQSEWRVSRRVRPSPLGQLLRPRARRRGGIGQSDSR
jgi:hypothetical protein